MKQTVLHQRHVQSKAKMTEFQGWQVPQFYTDAGDEYHAVRTAAGLFDVGFLGRIEIAGPDAPSLLDRLFTRNLANIAERSAHYGFLCNDAGGILDDVLLFRLSDGIAGPRFMLTANAVNTDKIVTWIRSHTAGEVSVVNRTDETSQFALQGPMSAHVVEGLHRSPGLKKLRPRALKELPLLGAPVLVSRTGYTGEQGYEFFLPREHAEQLWDGFMRAGSELGLLRCGLASRDLLRLEMGYLLYGNDLDERSTPLEAGRDAFVDFSKEFIGSEALLRQRAQGCSRKLAGFTLSDKNVPRNGSSILSENREIGTVTSACFSPLMRTGIGLGYVVKRYAQAGQEIEIELRDKEITAKITELPFFRKKS
jgi:aminomethyltransferase